MSTVRPHVVPTTTSAAPTIPATVTGSPAHAIPMTAAHSGSVPTSRLARAGLVVLRARSCARNANTVHATARYPMSTQSAAPYAAVIAGTDWPEAALRASAIVATVASCTKVVRAESISFTADIRAMTVTCTARNRAAMTITTSPARGAVRPVDWVSNAHPITARTAAR